MRRINWLVLAIIVAGSIGLNLLVQTLPYGEATSAKTAEAGDCPLYEWRRAIETMFENLKRELHVDEFMVRDWPANECPCGRAP